MLTTSSIKCAIVPALIAMQLNAWSSATQAADDPRVMQLTFVPWIKFCLGKTDCFAGAEARGACAPSGGSVVIHTVDGKATEMSTGAGTRLTLEGDIRVQIDQDPPILISVSNCYASGCYGTFKINDEFVERLKRSSTITLEATTTAHRKISLSFSLANFARVYDGPGPEPKVTEVIISSKEMKERLEKEAEEAKRPVCDE